MEYNPSWRVVIWVVNKTIGIYENVKANINQHREPNMHEASKIEVIKDTYILAVEYTSNPKSKQYVGVGG